jgi:hypothetical protein
VCYLLGLYKKSLYCFVSQALNYEGGIIELHRLKENLTNVQADELDRFASLVDSIIWSIILNDIVSVIIYNTLFM